MERLVLGSSGEVNHYIETEDITSESVRQAIYSAPYVGTTINKYELLDNSYRATGGFETGDYLIPHPSEQVGKYIRRKNMSYYTNYVKPVVDAHVNPIFRIDPTRDNLSESYQMFVDNVDGNKTSLTRFMKKAAIRAKLHGVEFIVIDMSQIESGTVVRKSDIKNKRLYPYLYLVKPSQVSEWSIDKFGRMNYITYKLTNTIVNDKGEKDVQTETWTWTNDICKKTVGDKTEILPNTIGTIPVIPLYGAINDSTELIPQSDLYSIAKTNFSIFQATSELRERNRSQAFSILTFPIDEEDDYDNSEDPLKYGTSDCLIYKSGAQAPAFITPPADPSDVIMNEINFMIKEIYRMASMQFAFMNGSQSNVSGLSKEWDNQNLFQTISELSDGLQEVEYKIASVFGLYMNEDINNIAVSYNKQFGITDPTAVLTNATQSLALNICPEFNIEVKKQVVRSVLKDIDSGTIDDVIKSLEDDSTARNPLETEAKVVQPTSR